MLNIDKEGNININDKEYNYKLYDINGLINIIRYNKKFKESLEKEIRKYKNNKEFSIYDLIKDYINFRIRSKTYFLVLHKNNTVISHMRINYYYNTKYMYINMLFTNDEYRNLGICKNLLSFLINKTKEYIKTYQLDVLVDNIPAIKCYEHNGFKIKEKKNYTQINKDTEEKKIIYYYVMKLEK